LVLIVQKNYREKEVGYMQSGRFLNTHGTSRGKHRSDK